MTFPQALLPSGDGPTRVGRTRVGGPATSDPSGDAEAFQRRLGEARQRAGTDGGPEEALGAGRREAAEEARSERAGAEAAAERRAASEPTADDRPGRRAVEAEEPEEGAGPAGPPTPSDESARPAVAVGAGSTAPGAAGDGAELPGALAQAAVPAGGARATGPGGRGERGAQAATPAVPAAPAATGATGATGAPTAPGEVPQPDAPRAAAGDPVAGAQAAGEGVAKGAPDAPTVVLDARGAETQLAPDASARPGAAAGAEGTQAASTARLAELNARAATALEQIRVAITPGMRRATIALTPLDLGRVDVTLALDRDGLVAHMRVEAADTYKALERHMPELRSSLERAGIDVARVDISHGGPNQDAPNDGSRDARGARSSNAAGADAAHDTHTVDAFVRRPDTISDARVDTLA